MVARNIKFIIFAYWFAKLQKLRDCFTAFFIWILVLVCAVEFMPHKRALVREKQNTLFFLARPRKLQRLTAAAHVNCCGSQPPLKGKTCKHRTNEMSGVLADKNIVFPPLFLKKWAGHGAEPHRSLMQGMGLPHAGYGAEPHINRPIKNYN